jgi:hypothetical protein
MLAGETVCGEVTLDKLFLVLVVRYVAELRWNLLVSGMLHQRYAGAI